VDPHDQELLDKQLRAIYQPPRPAAGLAIMAIVAVFLGGMIAGGLLSAATEPIVANANGPVVAFLDAGAPVTRN
jgi:hypothetical protein